MGTGKNKFEDMILVAVFLLLLLLPMMIFYLNIDPVSEIFENRVLASYYPSGDLLEAIANFPDEYEPYFSDHFGLKYLFVRISNYINSRFPGNDTADFVTSGKDGWLFHYKPSYYRNETPLTTARKEKIKNTVLERKRWLQARGIKYLLVICPFKTTIYPEFAPENMMLEELRTPLDDLADYLKRDERIDLLDLRPLLFQARGQGMLFSPTDFHWTDLGALVASKAIKRELKKWFPPIDTEPGEGYKSEIVKFPGGELAERLGIEGFYQEEKPVFTAKETGSIEENYFLLRNQKDGLLINNNKHDHFPDIMLFHDSFGEKMRPFVSQIADRSAYIWEPRLRKSFIEYFKPDVVIESYVEINFLSVFDKKFYEDKTLFFGHKTSALRVPLRKTTEGVLFKVEASTRSAGRQIVDVKWNGNALQQLPLDSSRKLWEIKIPQSDPQGPKSRNLELIYRVERDNKNSLILKEFPFNLHIITGTKIDPGGNLEINDLRIETSRGYNLIYLDEAGRTVSHQVFDLQKGRGENEKFITELRRTSRLNSGYLILFAHGNVKRGMVESTVGDLRAIGCNGRVNDKPHQGHYFLYDLTEKRTVSEKWGIQPKELIAGNEPRDEGFVIYDFQVLHSEKKGPQESSLVNDK